MLTDYENSFTDGLNGKCVMNQSLKIPPYLKHMSLHYLVKCKCQETNDNLKEMS